MRVNSTLHLLE